LITFFDKAVSGTTLVTKMTPAVDIM